MKMNEKNYKEIATIISEFVSYESKAHWEGYRIVTPVLFIKQLADYFEKEERFNEAQYKGFKIYGGREEFLKECGVTE